MSEKSLLSIIPAAILVALLCACPGEKRSDYVSDQAFEAGTASVGSDQALVVYASGDVRASTPAGWKQVEVGDVILENQSLTTGEGAFCELSFGEAAIIRVEENTQVEINDMNIKPSANEIEIMAAAGTILCKVERISGSERFTVKTRTAICGVRGTEFGVTVSKTNDTILAVREGNVAILPSSIDVESLKKRVPDADPAVIAALDDLASARIVGAGQQAVITEQAVQDARVDFEKVSAAYEKLAIKKEASPEEKAAFRTIIKETKTTVEKKTDVIKPISPEQRENLKRLEDMRIFKFPEKKAGDTSAKQVLEKTPEKLVRIGVRVIPSDAEIRMGDKLLGRGRFQGLFKPGEKLELVIAKTGFEAKKLSIEASISGQKSFEVKLNELGYIRPPEGKKDDQPDNKEREKTDVSDDTRKDDKKPVRRESAKDLFEEKNLSAFKNQTELAYDDGKADSNNSPWENAPGGQIGVVFSAPQYPCRIKSVSFYVTGNGRFNTPFKVSVAALDVRGEPGDALLKQFVRAEAKTGDSWVTVDVSSYNLIAVRDFLVAMEWLTPAGEKGGNAQSIGVDATSPDRRSWAKYSSDGKWKRIESAEKSVDTDVMIRAVVEY